MTVLSDALAWFAADPTRWDNRHLLLNAKKETCRWDQATKASIEGAIMIATQGRGTPEKMNLYNRAIDAIEAQLSEPICKFAGSFDDMLQLIRKAMI